MAVALPIEISVQWAKPGFPGQIVRCVGCTRPQTRPYFLELLHQGQCFGRLALCVDCEKKYRIKLSFTPEVESTTLGKRRDQGEPGSLNVSESQT